MSAYFKGDNPAFQEPPTKTMTNVVLRVFNSAIIHKILHKIPEINY